MRVGWRVGGGGQLLLTGPSFCGFLRSVDESMDAQKGQDTYARECGQTRRWVFQKASIYPANSHPPFTSHRGYLGKIVISQTTTKFGSRKVQSEGHQ